MFPFTERRRRMMAAIIGVSVLSVAIGTMPAFAEGQWHSSLNRAYVGFNSRSWQDSNTDAADTVVNFSGCSVAFSSGFSSTEVTLYDEFGAFPDLNIGTKRNTCNRSDWGPPDAARPVPLANRQDQRRRVVHTSAERKLGLAVLLTQRFRATTSR